MNDNTGISDVDWKRDLLTVLYLQRGLIVGLALLVSGCAGLIAFTWPPTYRCSTAVLVQGQRLRFNPGLLTEADPRILAVSKEDLVSELEILRSPDLARRALLSLGRGGPVRGLSRFSRGDRIEEFMKLLEVDLLPASKIVRVSLTGYDPDETVRMLRTFLSEYIVYRDALLNPSGQEQFYDKWAEVYRKQVQDLNRSLVESGAGDGSVLPESEIAGNLETKTDLMRLLQKLEDEKIASEFLNNPALNMRIERIQAALAELDQRNARLRQLMLAQARINREIQVAVSSYTAFSKRAEEARMQRAIAEAELPADVSVLGDAGMKAELVFPRRIPLLALGLAAGLVLGLGMGFLNEFLDRTCRIPRDFTGRTGLPVVCSIKTSRRSPC